VTILVTGGAGFIASHLVDRLLLAPSELIVVLDKLTYAGKRQRVPDIVGRTVFIHGDIANRVLVRDVLRRYDPRAIIHAAAETHVARSIDTAQEFIDTNILGTFILLDEALHLWSMQANQAIRRDFRFLYVSTDEVYGSLPLGVDQVWTEDSPLQANNPYSASKAGGELLVRSYFRTFGLPTIITRGSNTYGSRQHPEKLIPAVIEAAHDGRSITVHGDGRHVRDWMHVVDHVLGILAALDLGTPGEVYNLSAGCERANLDVIAVVLQEMVRHGVPNAKLHFGTDRLGNDRRYAMSADKARRALGWGPQFPRIEEELPQVIRDCLKDSIRTHLKDTR